MYLSGWTSEIAKTMVIYSTANRIVMILSCFLHVKHKNIMEIDTHNLNLAYFKE